MHISCYYRNIYTRTGTGTKHNGIAVDIIKEKTLRNKIDTGTMCDGIFSDGINIL
jgi:hypothetical protein